MEGLSHEARPYGATCGPAFRAGLEAPRPAPDTVAHPKLGPIFGFVLRWH
jgi:hypothetical protein